MWNLDKLKLLARLDVNKYMLDNEFIKQISFLKDNIIIIYTSDCRLLLIALTKENDILKHIIIDVSIEHEPQP